YPSEEMGEKDAEACLMTRLMMSKADAERLMTKAAESGEAWAVLKFPEFATTEKRAQMQGVGVSMGMPTPQTPEADPYTGIPVYGVPYQEEIGGQFTNVPAMQDPNTQGINIGGELQWQSGQAGPGTPGGDAENAPPIPEEERQLAEQAAALGQRNVFDHAAIGGLSKVYDTNAVIDSYLPEFMDTIDRLGRVLFLYYWKHDDFMERYGSGDTVEMEDLLRSTYKQLGKLTLKLRERAIGREDAESAQL
ncbi:MAG: hypothetical protein IJS66_04420, partial [Bacteroidales bacterium]|nr:hypothetical protein [Bacteroidales bacterium]